MKTDKMHRDIGLVFIHGAGLGSFIWDEIKPLLNSPSLMVDFPNRNKGEKANSKLSFKDYSDLIIEKVERSEFERIIIVTHSIGGCIGLKVAEYFSKRTVGFVSISSAIPDEGNSYISCLPTLQGIITKMFLRLLGTKPPKTVIIKSLCNDLTSEQSEKIVNNFTPEAITLYTQKCNANIPETNKLYIKLTQDKAFPASLQDNSIANFKTENVITLSSGHLPMISQPGKLVDILNNFSTSCK